MTEDGSVGVIEAFRRAIGPLVTRHPSLVTAVLIHVPRLNLTASHGDSITYNFLIGGKRGV